MAQNQCFTKVYHSLLPLFRLICFLILFCPILPHRHNHNFEQFIARQHFPLAGHHRQQQQEGNENGNSASSSSPSPTFRANCSVPICEGPLAQIFCSGPLISSAWYFGVQQQCPGSRLRNEPENIVTSFRE
jgi:hypothetical protein